MADYTKTIWENGDIITAEKLNNMEDGIANNSENACKCNGPTITIHTSGLSTTNANYMADPIAPGLSLTEFAMSTILVEKAAEETSTLVAVIPFISAYLAPHIEGKTAYGAKITVPSFKLNGDTKLNVGYDYDTGELSINDGGDPLA